MKQFFLLLTIVCSLCTEAFSQHEILRDGNGKKILRGIITRDDLAKDSAFIPWYRRNQEAYTPDPSAVAALQKNNDIQLVVFMGTWCGDSQAVIPKFYLLTDAAGFPQEQITLLAVDRSKRTGPHLAEAFGIRYVPTIIIMRNGQEIGRVVEYGESGKFDKELAAILSK